MAAWAISTSQCPVTVVRETNRMGDSVAAVCRPPALFDNKTGGLQTAATEPESGHDLVQKTKKSSGGICAENGLYCFDSGWGLFT